MGNDNDSSLAAEIEMRQRAEERLQAQELIQPPKTELEMQRLVHELEVHQIQLEMLNAELRQARDDQESALQNYTLLYDFAPVSYVTLDCDGEIRAANLTFATLLGFEREKLPGMRFGLFVAEEARPLFVDFLGQVFAGIEKVSCEMPLITGRSFPHYVQIEAVSFASGQECHIAVIDIAERKRVDEALRASEDKFSRAFQAVPDLFSISSLADGRFIEVNEAFERTLQYDRSEIIGRTTQELGIWQNPDDREQVVRMLREQRKVRDLEINLCNKSGSVIVCLLSAVLIEMDGAKHLAAITKDITERKLAELEIERLNRDLAERATELEAVNLELEAFNYTVAHDLRKPLTVMNGYCQILKEVCSERLDEACKRYINEAYEGTWRMNRLIDALLNFSRLAHVEPRRESVNLSALAYELAAELKVSEPDRRVRFLIADAVSVAGEPALLRSVMDNLLSNAWKYTGDQAEAVIEFGTTMIDGKMVCFVRDNGAGFDPADMGKIFIPFQRLPGAEERKGFGIGLATVERIIRRHGGKVWAEGELGKGACFFFSI